MNYSMEQHAQKVITMLITNGYEAFYVGGYVRDRFMKRPIKDIDIATSATPEEVMRIFPRVVPTGLHHGTVTVLIENIAFEVTTFRTESAYENHRRPTGVQFVTSLMEDLRRRDFTINAMAIDQEGKLIDPFGGADSIQNKEIRCVGNPHERFHEDALRMLRCIRFAAAYNFQVEKNTWEALLTHKKLLSHIAMERVQTEIESIMEGQHPQIGITLLAQSGLLKHTKKKLDLPLDSLFKDENQSVLTHFLKWDKVSIRWAFLFIVLHMDEHICRQNLRQLTFAKKKIQSIIPIVSFHYWMIAQANLNQSEPNDLDVIWKQALLCYSKEIVQDWLKMISDPTVKAQILMLPEKLSNDLIHSGYKTLSVLKVTNLGDLNIRGVDIVQAYGKKEGPWVGKVLNQLLQDVIFLEIENEKDILLKQALKYKMES